MHDVALDYNNCCCRTSERKTMWTSNIVYEFSEIQTNLRRPSRSYILTIKSVQKTRSREKQREIDEITKKWRNEDHVCLWNLAEPYKPHKWIDCSWGHSR